MTLLLSLMLTLTTPQAGIFRYPDISGDTIAFSLNGDIYTVPATGGQATRLTSHEGRELFPKFSPDGQWIAFSGEYNGNRQVYVIPAKGGVPKQLTWYNDVGPMPPRGGFDYRVLDWTPDGERILFRGNRLPQGERLGKYFTISYKGGFETALEIPEGSAATFSPDGKKLAYTPIAREFRTWKRYRGGRAQDVWIYDLEAHQSKQLTNHIMTDNQPTWVGDKIYFTSDRDYTLNLFSYDVNTGAIAKVTNHDTYDVLWPSSGLHQIVYEHAGRLRRFDTRDQTDHAVDIQVISDFTQAAPHLKNVSAFIDGMAVAPKGERVVVDARGDLYSIPAKHGEIRNLTQTQGIREKDPAWSADGMNVAYLSDRSGEYEIYVRDQAGYGAERRITNGNNVWAYPPHWSPDGKKLAYADRYLRLWVVDAATGSRTEIAKGLNEMPNDFDWSPDSQWIAYAITGENRLSDIHVYNLKSGESTQLTSSFTSDFEPVFSPDSKYLFFTSSRDFNLRFSDFEFTYLYDRSVRIYAATLNDGVANPLAPQNDIVELPKKEEPKTDKKAKKGKKGNKKDADKADAEPKPKGMQTQGFESRIFVLPLEDGSYANLQPTETGLFFMDADRKLRFFSWEDRKAQDVLSGVRDYRISADGKKLLYQIGPKLGVTDAKPGAARADLDLSDLMMKIDPRAEWKQIYEDGVRLIRDYFYDADMHGFDWDQLAAKYRDLLPLVSSRDSLDYLFGELGAELNSGHYYVNSGDAPRITRDENGLLGAEILADTSGFYKVGHIFPGENWHDDFRNPLRAVGVNVKTGDFILAVDGVDVTTDTNFYAMFEGKGGDVVTLLVNDKPQKEGAREERVRTITSELNLRYLDWVATRREAVEKLSGGRVGYIHLPNTAVEGNREMFKNMYAQFTKDALIFDDRYNGGGFIPENMIEMLERPVLGYWAQRNRRPFRSPGVVHTGPKACLINGLASSGGDAFPFWFRQRNIGKIFGTRTWGGLIGLQGNPGFLDGGSLSIPVFRIFDPEGNWVVENEGVPPDVEVLDRPELIASGQDPTLEAAVKHLLEELEKNPPKAWPKPTPPDESKYPKHDR